MYKRIAYTLKNAFVLRKLLSTLSHEKHQIRDVVEISSSYLRSLNIDILALDFDGVLAPHGSDIMDADICCWLSNFSNKFNQKNIFILSNKPTDERYNYFKQHFPDIQFVSNVKKKPYPDGLIKIQQLSGCKVETIALVDDRILTGGLACLIAGSHPILLKKVRVNFKHSFFAELFFAIVRWAERKIWL